jgi:hypothetical protein
MAALPEIPEIDAILFFFKWKGPILISHVDSTLNFEFATSFCLHLPVILFDLCHLFCKKARMQGFIKKFITPEIMKASPVFEISFPQKRLTWVIYDHFSLLMLKLKSFKN